MKYVIYYGMASFLMQQSLFQYRIIVYIANYALHDKRSKGTY